MTTRQNRRAPRRRTVWSDTHINFDIAAGGAQATQDLSVGVLTLNTELTLTRTLIRLTILPSIPGANSGEQDVSWGMAVTSIEAFQANVLPDPNVAGDTPTRGWIVKGRTVVIDSSTAGETYPPEKVELDIRSQRKISQGVPYLIIVNSDIRGVAQSIRVFGLIRTLWKLP